MTTTAQIGSQTLLRRGDGNSPEAFTTVYEVVSIGNVGQENDLIEATHMQSTNKEFIYGLSDGLEIPVVVNYKPADSTHAGLITDNRSKVVRNFKLTMPSGLGGTSFTFSAIVKGWNLAFMPNEVVHASFTLKVTDAIVGPN